MQRGHIRGYACAKVHTFLSTLYQRHGALELQLTQPLLQLQWQIRGGGQPATPPPLGHGLTT